MKHKAIDILVVEDSVGNASLIRRFFESDDMPVNLTFAINIKAGRAVLRKTIPDLVLIDYELPDGKGTELLPGPGIDLSFPMVIMTSFGDEKIAVEAMKAGASDYIKKSVESMAYLPRFCERILREWEHILNCRKAEKALLDSEAQFRAIFEQSTDSILLIEPETGRIVASNKRAHENLGYTREEFVGINISDFEAIESEEESKKHIGSILANGEETFQTKHRTKEGQIRDIHVNARKIKIKEKSFLLSVLHDFTERRQAEEQQRLSNSVFNNVTEAIMVVDTDRNIVSVNPAFTKITGYTADEAIGKNPRFLKSGRHDQTFYKNMMDSIDKSGHWAGEIWDRKKNGEIYPKWMSITAIKDNEGSVVQYIALFSDITKRKETEKQLHLRAYYDPLTKLPNRTLGFERLSQAIMQGNRFKRSTALLYVDLDHFKQVNDTFGHIIGDTILVEASKRLSFSVRETDTVARTGGDEFLIILPEVNDQGEITIVAEKILENMLRPFQVEGRDLFLGASIGITVIPDDGIEVTTLLKNADMAMYQAKSSGRNNYQFFSKKLEKRDKERTLLEWDLRQAVDNQELVLHYQPIVDVSSLKTVSLEALVRWNHPHRGIVMPNQFIPLAENSDLISKIGKWVLLTASTQMKLWQSRYRLDTDISVNLSGWDFRYGEVCSSITDALDKSGLAAESLIIEITEGLMLDPNEDALKKLQTIRDVGIRISIDDFGTGYSSLSYLARYPIDYLKIDKSFIKGVQSASKKNALVEAIIRMGQSMGMEIIAEGVETYEVLSYLRDLGCDKVQGYYFSKPLSAEDYEAVLEKQKIDSY